MKDRIIRFMTAEGLSSSRLADEIGVQRSSVSHLLGGRNNPSYEFIHKMLSRFQRLNAEWLILGTGPMYKDMHQTELFSTPPQQRTETTDAAPGPIEIKAFLTEEPPVPAAKAVSEALPGTEVPSSGLKKPEIVIGKQNATQMILVYADNTFRIFSLIE
jgi:transcriptional regulator with XRE-family HTH domain